MFNIFGPAWLKSLPEHLKPTSKRQIEQLEALRVLEGIPHPAFRNVVLRSPPVIKRHLHELKKRIHNSDERKVWATLVRLWKVSMNQIGISVSLSESDIALLVNKASNYGHLCDRLIEIVSDDSPDPFDVAKKLAKYTGGDYTAAVMAAYEGQDHAEEIKARVAEILV
jgi:hypothetical protein